MIVSFQRVMPTGRAVVSVIWKSYKQLLAGSLNRMIMIETFEIMKKIILIMVISSLLPCMGEGSGMRAIYCIS